MLFSISMIFITKQHLRTNVNVDYTSKLFHVTISVCIGGIEETEGGM
jgi:hypothetical protein